MLRQKFLKCVSTFTKVDEKALSFLKRKHINNVRYNCCSHKVPNVGPWNVLFFGTDEFALQSLQALHTTCRQKKLVRHLEIVTAYKGEENAVIKYAREQKIVIHSWPPRVEENQFELGVVVSFGHLIPSKVIKLFPMGMINVHGSLLPRWRGAAPICHALINGDTNTGVSIMKIEPKKFDVGSVLAQERIEIQPDETYIELYEKLARIGANALIDTIAKLPDVLNTAKSQDEEKATYAPKVTQEMSFIKWNKMTATKVYNLQRGLNGIHPLRAYFNDQIVKLVNIKAVPETTTVSCTQEKVPGLAIFSKKSKTLYVSCHGNSWITVGSVIIPGRRPQSAADFGTGFILNRKEKSCVFR